MRYAFIFASINALAFASPAFSQASDPYANDMARVQIEKSRQEFSDFKTKTRNLYYAVGCKVLNEVDVYSVTFLGEQWFYNRYGAARTHKEATEARRAGYEQAKERGCDFWKENPASVIELREKVAARAVIARQPIAPNAYYYGPPR